ncbi:hypothetical protein [Microbacterium xanthum]|uniref:hypothetical protein n=1 Tax=Microbacterium xanthum TaxID=3079794 RepID=UPI002AD3F057|nr:MULTISPECIES: hypothetical protein [unclassified Microbacterium]MDZ8172081.1 hypothetical protein [Microbacterium sp. KSW-48]MDZ8202212.1 hypothetical protein [Microbacterium sp. SSW1-59]
MHDALVALATAMPISAEVVDPDLVTPGPWGFLVFALLGVVVILLITDMMRRIRRGRIRADLDEQLDAEQAAARDDSAAASGGTGDDDGDPASPHPR